MRSGGIRSNRWSIIAGSILLALLVGLVPPAVLAQEGGESPWSAPIPLSVTTPTSWFPDIAVDPAGRVHVVWDSQYWAEYSDEGYDNVMYTRLDEQGWWLPLDVVFVNTRGAITRPAIAVDASSNIHLLNIGGGNVGFRYRKVPADMASVAVAWSNSRRMDEMVYMSDIEIDQEGIIHVVYDRAVPHDPEDEPPREEGEPRIPEYIADIFYRQSRDGGETWSEPYDLFPTPLTGDARAQLEIDARGTLHVAWDAGWDRRTLYGEPQYGVYVNSQDGGLTWSKPYTIAYPARTNAQLAVGADGKGGVLLVWRATDRQEIFYTWSQDDGLTWTRPMTIPNFFARRWTIPFDAYDMEADSAGRIHLVAVGQTQIPASRADFVPLGVYHLVWDGRRWSEPEPIAVYPEDRFPEYPKLDISQGNQLHVVWFVRDNLWQLGEYQVWYSSRTVDAPTRLPPPTPTPTPGPTATPTPTITPTATPMPPIWSKAAMDRRAIYTENDDVADLLLSLSPLGLIVLGLWGARRWKRRHSSRLR